MLCTGLHFDFQFESIMCTWMDLQFLARKLQAAENDEKRRQVLKTSAEAQPMNSAAAKLFLPARSASGEQAAVPTLDVSHERKKQRRGRVKGRGRVQILKKIAGGVRRGKDRICTADMRVCIDRVAPPAIAPGRRLGVKPAAGYRTVCGPAH